MLIELQGFQLIFNFLHFFRVTVSAQVNEVVDDRVLIKRYEKEISRLRARLKACGNHEIELKLLREDNQKLKDDNEKLVQYIKTSQMMKQNGQTQESNHTFTTNNQQISKILTKKLKNLERIEEDQKQRERDVSLNIYVYKKLEKYHRWLHSIEVKYDGEDFRLDLKDRLELMEKSVIMQAEELERTKKLFLRDLQIVQDELNEKIETIKLCKAKMKHQYKKIKEVKK